MFSCSYQVQFSLYFFYWGNSQLYLRWLLAVVGSSVVDGGGINCVNSDRKGYKREKHVETVSS